MVAVISPQYDDAAASCCAACAADASSSTASSADLDPTMATSTSVAMADHSSTRFIRSSPCVRLPSCTVNCLVLGAPLATSLGGFILFFQPKKIRDVLGSWFLRADDLDLKDHSPTSKTVEREAQFDPTRRIF